MLRTLAAVIAFACSSAIASDFDYNFDGDFSSVFTRLNAEDDRYFFDQEDGELAYFVNDGSTNSGGDPENNVAQVHNTFKPVAGQSWRASVDITLPLIYDSLDLDPGYIEAGIITAFTPNGFDSNVGIRFFESTFRIDDAAPSGDVERIFLGGVDDDDLPREDFVRVGSTNVTVNFEIHFDALTQVLSALADGSLFFSAPIDDSGPIDWNMDDSDQFMIALFAGSSLEPITGDDAIIFDNFRAEILPIPEPAGVVILVGSLAGLWRARDGRATG